MEVSSQYQAITKPLDFLIPEYKTPLIYQDPTKQIIERKNFDYKNKPHQGKFKPSKRKKTFFIDEQISPVKENPSPDKYKTQGNLLKERSKSTQLLNKVDPKFSKHTFLDQIQYEQKTHKNPGIAKYNLLTITDFSSDKQKKLKNRNNPEKISNLDNYVALSATIPGPGNHNPHDSIKHLKINREDHKSFQQKVAAQEKKLKSKRAQSAKVGPSSYRPVVANTFDSLKKQFKAKPPSKWSHGEIEIRKGARSAMKSPSCADYQLVNQWSSTKSSSGFKIKPEKAIDHVKLLNRTVKSARTLSVYRD